MFTECQDLQKIWISRIAKIRREIVYILYVRNVWICREIECPKLQNLNWKLCTLCARNVWISRKIEYPLLHIFNGKLCTLYMYEMSGFAEKLNIQNYENSMGNCVHYICTEYLDLQKNWISIAAKIQPKIVYVIYVRNVWISKKIECPKLRKFKGKLCTLHEQNIWMCRKIEYLELRKFNRKLCRLYMYGLFGLAKKLNVQSWENSTENYVRYIRTESLD